MSQPVTDLSQEVVVDLLAPEGAAHVFVEITSDNAEFSGVLQKCSSESF